MTTMCRNDTIKKHQMASESLIKAWIYRKKKYRRSEKSSLNFQIKLKYHDRLIIGTDLR